MKKILYPSLFLACIIIFSVNDLAAQTAPRPGDLVINEFMVNPVAVSDTKGEWIELFNTREQDLLLNGLMLLDLGSNKHTLTAESDLVIPAGGYFLMGRHADPAENGGIEPEYVYTSFSLGNTSDEIILALPSGEIVDAVSYDSGWPLEDGASLELTRSRADTLANNDPSSWHAGILPYGSGDLGTPGHPNAESSGTSLETRHICLSAYPNPCSGKLFVSLQTQGMRPVQLSLINVLGQQVREYSSIQTGEQSLVIDLTHMQKGLYWLQLRAGESRQVVSVVRD